jgi:hypothetical protein
MIAKSNLYPPLGVIGFVAVVLGGLFVGRVLAVGAEAASGGEAKAVPLHIEVLDGQGVGVAGPESHAVSKKGASAALSFDREYQPDDRIVFGGPQRMAARVDESIPECVVYLAGTSKGNVSYEIPYGREEKQTGSAYAPESFSGKSHRVTVRTLDKKEIASYRNLALNPCDAQVAEQAPAQIFPHASTNSVSRSLFDFAARNAIDGVTQNGHHGVWPYQSWGPQLRTDLWWKVEFGRPVELDKIRLMVRADFPHDSYWKSADVEFSDGSHVSIRIATSAAFQEFSFPKRRVSWVRLNNLVPEDASRWCSFIEVEAWGRDLP